MNHWTDMVKEWKGDELFHILLIILIAWFLSKLIKHLVPRIVSTLKPNYRFFLLPWIPLLRLLIIITAIILITPVLITPTKKNLLVLFGASGLAIGFAFKDCINCLIAGVLLIFERPYRVGDWVQIDNVYGEVISLGLRTVKIQTADDNTITIPHSILWTSTLSNATSGKRDLLCVIDFFIHPGHDNTAARQTLFNVAITSAYLNLSRPIIVVMSNKPVGVHYKVKAYPMDAREQFLFIADITERAQTALHEIELQLITAPASVFLKSY